MSVDPLAAAGYLRSVHHLRDLPPDRGREVAIAGRSNAGKSSAINAICRQRSLARTSRTPGRTQQLVYFRVAEDRHLVDLPGYGYAKVPEALREHWRVLIEGYLQSRQALAGLVLVMDARHPLREFDCRMIGYARARALPFLVLLTKADKLGRAQQQQVLRQVQAELGGDAGVIVFSAVSGLGVEAARAQLWQLLEGVAEA